MAIYPGATYRRVAWAETRNDSTPPTVAVAHIAASDASSLWHYFNSTRIACSHFFVRWDGHVEQYIDTNYLSSADYRGGHRTVSIETQGRSGPWTHAQKVALAKLFAWLSQHHPIPLQQMRSSSLSESGIGWHRLGIDGNFPPAPSLLAGRLQIGGGELWSSARGKTCPTDACIKQMPEVIQMARELTGNSKIDSEEGFLMALSERDQEAVLWNIRENKKLLEEVRSLLKAPIKDGSGAAPPRDIAERTLDVSRRILANLLANDAVELDIEIDAEAADALVDALVERLPAPVAQAVADGLYARLAQ